MKKRAMKKHIPRNTPYCYRIVGIEHAENGMPILKCKYCKNFYFGFLVNDSMICADGSEIPVKRRQRMCRYTGEELIYDDTKECGVGY